MIIDSFRGDYAFLSNFYPSRVLPPTLEHHYQALKTTTLLAKHAIMNAATPAEAKKLGRTMITNYWWWDENKYRLMQDLICKKFTEPALIQMLLNTGNMLLIEGNSWHDNFWGRCQCKECCVEVGRNNLGQILMSVRESLRIMIK